MVSLFIIMIMIIICVYKRIPIKCLFLTYSFNIVLYVNIDVHATMSAHLTGSRLIISDVIRIRRTKYSLILEIDHPPGLEAVKDLTWILPIREHLEVRILSKVREFVTVFLRQFQPV